ncbi:hypothetical protein KS4_01050 [Poriferisphaera corsica]|uniref:DUF4253 domain-containing protein n=1 Tax=Poriferisphaera corsica TaxID=2528020 RepID=A0A517YPD3_9BACT|nr:DUF4253 domain-containing protein [Poriferisphaera corsica]QDU32076.1 hypothetical protein KS4_01050 [Poriferisphaera corsica]
MQFIQIEGKTSLEKTIQSHQSDTKLFICGLPEEQDNFQDLACINPESPSNILKSADEIDVQEWFASRRRELEDEHGELDFYEGTWPGESENSHGIQLNEFGTIKTDVTCITLPITSIWKVFAHLKYGNWNDCPSPETHCAIWKYWEEKYGAKVVAVSNDIVEAYVTKPPTTQEEAMKLAWEQFIYCQDIVLQGVERVANLASAMKNNQYWYFWWD